MTSRSSVSSASSHRSRALNRLKKARAGDRASHEAATPGVEPPSVVRRDGSGESGGGGLDLEPKTLVFGKEVKSSNLVQASIFPPDGVCGATIGQGMFFCLRPTPCIYQSHRSSMSTSFCGTPGTIYIPSLGAAQTAFCKPCLDDEDLQESMVHLITKKEYPIEKLKHIFNLLQDDPYGLDEMAVEDYLRGDTNVTFKERMKRAMTPSKSSVKHPDNKTLIQETTDLVNFVTEHPTINIPTPVKTEGNEPPAFAEETIQQLLKAVKDSYALLGDTIALSHMASTEIEEVRGIANTAVNKLSSTVGTDPGIGAGDDTGLFTSAWEGIEYVNSGVCETSSELGRAKTDSLRRYRDLDGKVKDLRDNSYNWDEILSSRLIEKTGEYAGEFKNFVHSLVKDTVDEWIDKEEEDEINRGRDDADRRHGGDGSRPRGRNGGNRDISGGGGRGSDDDDWNGGFGNLGDLDGSKGENLAPTSGRLDLIADEVRTLREEVNYLKSISSTGYLKFDLLEFEFESEAQLLAYLKEVDAKTSLPKDLHRLFVDLWAALDYASSSVDGENRQSSDTQLAKQQESALKAKFSSEVVLSRWAGFRRTIPLVFEPPNTPVSSDPITKPLPGLKTFSAWDNLHDGTPGRKQLIRDEFDSHLATTKREISHELYASDFHRLRKLGEVYLSTTKDHKQFLFEWIKDTYDHEKESCSDAEAWALVAGCIRAIFLDVRDARLLGRALTGLNALQREARLIWAMGMGIMKIQEFIDHKIHGHTSCVSVYTQYMNRARTPLSSFRALEQKVKTINGELGKLTNSVEKVKTKVNSRSPGGGGGGGGGGTSTSGATPSE